MAYKSELEILEMRDRATVKGLRGYKCLYELPLNVIADVYNGIGASCFPAVMRKMLDRLNPTLQVCALIHDVRYYLGRGTIDDFTEANIDFEENGTIEAVDCYRWYDPRRYWVAFKAHRFSVLCQRFGWMAYLMAIEERRKKECVDKLDEC